jgi:hypothetical protein
MSGTSHDTENEGLDKEHLRTWNGFLSLVKWIIIGNIGLLFFLFMFRTHD